MFAAADAGKQPGLRHPQRLPRQIEPDCAESLPCQKERIQSGAAANI